MLAVSARDKLALAAHLESQALTLAKLQAYQPMAKDDGLKKLVEAGIALHEGQIKHTQEFLHSHGLL